MRDKFYNIDCVAGAKKHLKNNSIDLIITDPPYGIEGDKLHKHYNRNEKYVIDGYVEIPKKDYEDFSLKWILEAERVLKPGGSMYIISGYTNLVDILNALKKTSLKEVNHIVWKYNFGVYTKTKYISSHYHILYYIKGKAKHTFNTFSRFSDSEKFDDGRSKNYHDREDVWNIKREYKPGQIKNKNELPQELLKKMILYSSKEKDLICDFFLGSFSTAKVAKGLNRYSVGFEVSKKSFVYQEKVFNNLKHGFLKKSLRKPPKNLLTNSGKKITNGEKEKILNIYYKLKSKGETKKKAIEKVSTKFGRGYWSIIKLIEKNPKKKVNLKFNF